MKMRLVFPLILISSLFLSGCDSSDGLLDDKESTDHIVPERPEPGDPKRPRPSEDAPVITSDVHTIYDVDGQPILFRGINLEYGGEVEFNKSLGIDAVAAVGSNVVRLLLNEDTTANTLETALRQIVNANLVAILSLNGPGGEPFCTDNQEALVGSVEKLWLDRWLPVLAQDQFQPYMMFNLARGWGPVGINDANSSGYLGYLANYKTAIREIRKAGFKVPLVIDAPGCGEDFNAFLGDRARELRVADLEGNTVLSLSAYGELWNSPDELNFNLTAMANESAPFILAEMGGSGSQGESSVDHLAIMAKAMGDNALIFDIPWVTADDKATYAQIFETPLNLVGAAVLYDLFVPRQYVTEGNLQINLFLEDSAGRTAIIEQMVSALRRDNWTKVRREIAGLNSVITHSENPIDLTAITKLGFSFAANGKSETIRGDIRVDNVVIERGGEPEPILNATFSSATEGFQRSWGAGAGLTENPVAAVDGALHIQPVWGVDANDGDGGGNARTQIEVSNYTPLSFDMSQPFSVSLDVFIPEEYAEENIQFTFVLKDGGWQYGQLYWVGDADLPRGVTTTLKIDVEDISALPGISNSFVGVGPPNAVAFAFSGITSAKSEPIVVDNFRITVPSQLNANELFRAGFDADTGGFSRSWGAGAETGAAPITQENGELSVLPVWGAGANDGDGGGSATAKIEVSNYAALAMDMAEPFTIAMDIFIPEEYASESLELKIFVKDGGWQYAQIGYFGHAQLMRGVTQPITVEITNILNEASYLAPDFSAAGAPNAFGFEIGGVTTLKSEPIRVDNFVVSKPEAAKEVVMAFDFSAEDQVSAFQATPSASTFTESALTMSRQQDYGVAPFGWLAWSWYGNSGDKAVLDLSTEEAFEIPAAQAVSLTERGVEIIQGPNGIVETAEPVNFPVEVE